MNVERFQNVQRFKRSVFWTFSKRSNILNTFQRFENVTTLFVQRFQNVERFWKNSQRFQNVQHFETKTLNVLRKRWNVLKTFQRFQNVERFEIIQTANVSKTLNVLKVQRWTFFQNVERPKRSTLNFSKQWTFWSKHSTIRPKHYNPLHLIILCALWANSNTSFNFFLGKSILIICCVLALVLYLAW